MTQPEHHFDDVMAENDHADDNSDPYHDEEPDMPLSPEGVDPADAWDQATSVPLDDDLDAPEDSRN